MKIGPRIKSLRTGAGLTQEELSRLCGLSSMSIKNYESGRREPPTKTVLQIARLFGTPVTNLVDDNPPEIEAGHLQYLSSVGQLARQANGGDFSISAKVAEIMELQEEAVEFTAQDYELIEVFHALNQRGKKIALERVRELGEIERYKITPPKRG